MKNSFYSIIDSEIPVLVDFYADWCGPCKMLAPILAQVKDEMGNAIRIIKIDVDKNPSLATKYQVRGVPTMLLFKNGNQRCPHRPSDISLNDTLVLLSNLQLRKVNARSSKQA